MMLDIKPQHDESRNCYEDQIATVLSWMGRNHELMFSESWGFGFKSSCNEKTKMIGKRLDSAKGNLHKLLKKYHGIEIKEHKIRDAQIFLDIMQKEIVSGLPVLLFIDSFWCPWDMNYQKKHSNHCCIVTGYDNDFKSIYCSDGFYMKYGETLAIDVLKKSYKSSCSFAIINNERANVNWNDIIENALLKLHNREKHMNVFDLIRNFSTEMSSSIDLEVETKDYDEFWMSPLFSQLLQIENGRKQFSNVLKYLSERFIIEDLFTISKEVMQLAGYWSTVRALLSKACFVKDPNLLITRASSKISNIADEEEKIANKLEKINKNNISMIINTNKRNKKTPINYKNGETIFVDLTSYLNNKGFGNDIHTSSIADFTSLGHYFLNENLPLQKIWLINDMKFLFPDISDCQYDNISCNNQNISISPGQYYHIMILGCAEWGDFSDNLTIYYTDGYIEKIHLGFSDWCRIVAPVYGEVIAWIGKGAERKENSIQSLTNPTRLYAQKFSIYYQKNIIGIQLPDCPNIHIFAISFS